MNLDESDNYKSRLANKFNEMGNLMDWLDDVNMF